MTSRDIANLRLLHQGVSRPTCKTPGEVVASLTAMQAQDYRGGLWAIGLRLGNCTLAEVERAIAAKEIVRTWPMRGTLHFVAAADVHWMLKLLTPRIVAGAANRRKQLELDDATFVRAEKILGKALRDGKQFTRDKVYEVLERAGISCAEHRAYHIMWRLAQDGVLCFGAHEGKQPTFTLLEEWAPKKRKLERDEALGELAGRYFASHGPATAQDFVWWSGLKVADARLGIELAGKLLAKETVEGKVYYMGMDLVRGEIGADAASAVNLLPGFDEFMLGYRDRSAALEPKFAKRIVPGGNGIFMPTVVIGGQVRGVWKPVVRKSGVTVTPVAFEKFNKAEMKGIDAAGERYGRFCGAVVED